MNVMPGGPVVATNGRRLRIMPPEGWVWHEIDVPRVPPSMNNNEIRSSWRGFQTLKKDWQSEVELMLMVHDIKREAYQRAIAGAWMRFDVRAGRRDSGNYSSLISKALGDALDNYRAIPDDDDLHFFFTGTEFEGVTGTPRTRFVIALQPNDL